jgi:hypothetical protein
VCADRFSAHFWHCQRRGFGGRTIPVIPPRTDLFPGQFQPCWLTYFPHDAAALNALGDEAGESRLWAGIHFRSDIDTGLALGRTVAKLVIERAEKDGSQ